MDKHYKIRAFDPAEATESDFIALQQFENSIQAERMPDDPPRSVAAVTAAWQSTFLFKRVVRLVWDESETAVIGRAVFAYPEMEENRHIAQSGIAILPAYRCQRIASQLLGFIVAEAEAQERQLIVCNTNSNMPAGEQFIQRLGGRNGVAGHINQLKLAELPDFLVADWLKKSKNQAEQFRLGLWEGPYPEEQLANIVALHEVMSQQPLDDLEVEDFHITAEQLRQLEEVMAAQGIERWTLYLQEIATERLAGYTEVMFTPDKPTIVQQGDTGVFETYRGRGLGRWLKAAMLKKIIEERPFAQLIRTGNADSNAAMLKINQELGFKPYLAETIWQIETEKLRAYMAG